jgi:hypothetical protein
MGPVDKGVVIMTGRAILTSAVVALIVVIGYDRYKQSKA